MTTPADDSLVTLAEAAEALGTDAATLKRTRATNDIPLAGERPAEKPAGRGRPRAAAPLFRLGDVRAALERNRRKRRASLFREKGDV